MNIEITVAEEIALLAGFHSPLRGQSIMPIPLKQSQVIVIFIKKIDNSTIREHITNIRNS